jgi:N-acetylmuramoyl-L-alanine amidase
MIVCRRHNLILQRAFLVLMTICIMHAATVWANPDGSPAPVSNEQQALKGCAPKTFKVVLDVGHTPGAAGATSARGTREYWFNLQLAERIKEALVTNGFTATSVVTVHGVGQVQLAKRVEEANAVGADLLLSIHHDDVQRMYHMKWKVDGRLREFSDRFSGYSLFVSGGNKYFDASLTFAKLLGKELVARGMEYSRHHAEPIPGEGKLIIDPATGVYRYDQLFVLKFTKAPAVLLEAGVIVNRIEELVIGSPQGQNHVSAAVAAAVLVFCPAPSPKQLR